MVMDCMPRVEQMVPHAVCGLPEPQRPRQRLTVPSLRHSPLPAR